MTERLVKLSKEDSIAIIAIENGPMNVLSQEVFRQLDEACEAIAADPEVVVAIVTGAGERAFMAGADIKEFPESMKLTPEQMEQHTLAGHATLNKLDFLNKPTIAAVNGLAFGGGCELAMTCDIRIAEEQALFALPEIKLGLFPGGGGTQRLPRLVGEAKAKELMFTGDPISAQEAKAIGLVNQVVGKGEALKTAKKMAQTISQRSLPALQCIKQAVDQGSDLSLEDGVKNEARLFAKVFQTEDIREGVAAFIEKRTPKFKHR
ncbi:MAG: enoyl-CoA hydratase [Desulfitobacteriaceae bacterium]|nr:enoyl-CoA hydratase [Desulfitobacteriaceae bacterium]MDI6914466.1 enoyl-CoA hydratase [Desulfitobacteriaceae bacterium]